jgi:hypothetical protein
MKTFDVSSHTLRDLNLGPENGGMVGGRGLPPLVGRREIWQHGMITFSWVMKVSALPGVNLWMYIVNQNVCPF